MRTLVIRSLVSLAVGVMWLIGAANAQGTATVLLPEDLATMNPYTTTALITMQVVPAILEPLVGVDPDGNYYPILAREVPTVENGGVSDGGRTITWRLREGVTWSDGAPFTSDDVVFTAEAASTGTDTVRAGAFEAVSSVEAVDDLTVTVRYQQYNSSYLDQFQWGILPRHATGDPADMGTWDFNRAPVGTGPFLLGDWRTGDRIILERNPRAREGARPRLDNVVFLVVPSEETRAAMMQRGDADVMLWPGSNLREVWDATPTVTLDTAPEIWIMRMFLNLGERGNPVEGQAAHPVLGDVRVRQALALGIDYDLIIEELALGRVLRATSPFQLGWYACEVDGYTYDPERAAALLDEAGWVPGDDGVRVARGAGTAPDGTRLSLEMVGYSDFRLLEQTMLVIQDLYRDLGVEVNVRTVEQSVLFGGWSDRAARKTGDYDILVYDTGTGINPQLHVFDLLHSSRIPRSENEGAGGNYARWANPRADALLETAGTSPDLDERHAAYCEVAELVNEEVPQIFLYQFAGGNAYATRLKGFRTSTWAGLVWNVAEWYLE
ncbi:MAG: peptide ABC transporter substrate-binding protein [Trueperaceae bacterium]